MDGVNLLQEDSESESQNLCAWCYPGQPSPTGSHGICKNHVEEAYREMYGEVA